MLYIAIAIVLYPIISNLADRWVPTPNRQREVMDTVLRAVMPLLTSYLGKPIPLGDASPETIDSLTTAMGLCGKRHEGYVPEAGETRSHWCVLEVGHPGDHECSCGTQWTASVTE